VINRATERERQSDFLKSLLTNETEECKRLQRRLEQAAQNEGSIRRALLLMILIAVVAVVGLGYSAVLMPEFFDNATPLLVKLFCALGLGSVLCMIIFGGCWLHYRKRSNEVNEDCRVFLSDSQNEVKLDFQQSISVNKTPAQVYQIETVTSDTESRIIQFPRAS
jgi:uncharacterized integral membrane protein